MYNILSGAGFDKAAFGEWSMAMLVIPILFFVVIFMGRFFEDQFNKGWGFIGTYVAYLIVITFTGSPAFSMLAGLIGAGVGGFVLGNMLGGENYGGY